MKMNDLGMHKMWKCCLFSLVSIKNALHFDRVHTKFVFYPLLCFDLGREQEKLSQKRGTSKIEDIQMGTSKYCF